MTLTESRTETVIQIYIEGRIDVNSATQLQDAIVRALQKMNKLVLDFGGTDYLSSAGIRALLIGEKAARAKGGYMKMVNVCDTVRNTLRLSGLLNMLDIE